MKRKEKNERRRRHRKKRNNVHNNYWREWWAGFFWEISFVSLQVDLVNDKFRKKKLSKNERKTMLLFAIGDSNPRPPRSAKNYA